MKSIKEKAIESYTGSVIFDYEYSKGFEEGANYVVEEIENLVKKTIGDGETYHYNLYIGLINLIEQLKK